MKVIRFTKLKWLMVTLSAAVIISGWVFTFANGGFNLGIDFQAGLSLTVAIDSDSDSGVPQVRDALAGIEGATVTSLGDPVLQQYSIRVRDDGTIDAFQREMSSRVIEALETQFGGGTIEELETAYVGPRFSEDLTQQALALTLFALSLILLYIWFRFRLGYAISSIAALVHDVLFVLGFIGAFQLEVSTATVAAVLTIIGYSLNDTIVIFDRIRENEHMLRESDFDTIVNASITQSLSRTLITSITTLLAVTAIFVFTSGSIQLFAANLIVGVIVGTYSSIFVASPVLLGWNRVAERRRKRRDTARYHKGAVERGEIVAGSPSAGAQAPSVDADAAKRAVAAQRAAKKKKKKS